MPNAISAEQKAARADTIAAAALTLHRELRFDEWTVAQVARRAGVAKGTVFLYYDSKEALGLAIAQRLLGDWYDAVDAELERAGAPLTPAMVAQLLTRTLESRRPLRRTLSLVGPVFEHRAGRGAVAAYREWRLGRSSETGRRLERALGFLKPGEGVRLLLLIQALVIGYHSMAEPSAVTGAVLEDEALQPLRVDFARAVAEAIWIQLEGVRGLRS